MSIKGYGAARLLLVGFVTFLAAQKTIRFGFTVTRGDTAGDLQLRLNTHEEPAMDSRPTGLRVVLIGDSVTRYQYLSLAYFLRYGRWFDPDVTSPHLVNEKSFASWGHFYNMTTSLLSPLEKCDCFRERFPNKFEVDEHITENRYFYDPVRQNTLVYLQAFGNTRSALHGRIIPMDAFRDISTFQYHHTKSDSLWQHKDWGDVLERYVSRLNVTHVMMNAGLWPQDFGRNQTSRERVVTALNRTGLIGMWRTTTYENSHKIFKPAGQTDAVMGKLFDPNVLNVSWTRRLHKKYYWDLMHFSEPAYRVMNEELLEMVGHAFPFDYRKQNVTDLLDLDIA